jgi:outer membrane protein assembly factor BamD (BamD/ComL family)
MRLMDVARLAPSLVLAALLGGCGGGPTEFEDQDLGWRHMPPRGYVNVRTKEQKDPDELYSVSLALHDAKRHEEAASLFRLIADTAPDPGMRANALYKRGEALLLLGAYPQAYREFDAYQARYPDGDLVGRAKQNMMESALGLARVGQRDTILGLPIVMTSKPGIELLKSTLARFPRELFSDDYLLRLAALYHERQEYAEAEGELQLLLSDPAYKVSNSAPRALLLLGRVGLERYGGLSYDHKTLSDAKRAYEQFEIDYKHLLDDPQHAASVGLPDISRLIQAARAGILFVDEKLAERELALAEYYVGRGYPNSARPYLAYIMKHYPQTKIARTKAGPMLKELGQP